MHQTGLLLIVLLYTTCNAQQFKAIVFTETAGYHHKSIPAGVAAIEKLSEKHFFEMEWRVKSENVFSDEKLADVDVLIFLNTSGDILTDEEKDIFKKFIQSGKGFAGIHCASCTETNWEWYTQLVGRVFEFHPRIQTGKLLTLDRRFPGMELIPDNWHWTDEWYHFGDEKASDLSYLLRVDEASYESITKTGDPISDFHPISWYHQFDGGRSFYTALGHMPSSYQDDIFLSHIYGGIYWSATGSKP